MAGNKGRGRAAYTFNIEAVGFSRGEKLPDVVLKPPPLFPVSTLKADFSWFFHVLKNIKIPYRTE